MNSEDASSDRISEAPKPVVNRLSLYLRELQHLVRDGLETTSSTRLGSLLGFTDAQVRKDLAYFGQFGYPGVGYRCEELIHEIKRILGTDRAWPVVMVGAGNLGRALLKYKGFQQQGFHVVVAIDVDETKVGLTIDGIPIVHLDQLPEIVKQKGIRLAILAVPSTEAQLVADRLVMAGIEGILNFAPVMVSVPKQVNLKGVDLAIQLEQLSFAVLSGKDKS